MKLIIFKNWPHSTNERNYPSNDLDRLEHGSSGVEMASFSQTKTNQLNISALISKEDQDLKVTNKPNSMVMKKLLILWGDLKNCDPIFYITIVHQAFYDYYTEPNFLTAIGL